MKWLLAGLVLLAPIQACAREGAVKDITPELDAWSRGNGQRVSPTALRLRAGACLDTDRLPAGWKQDANDQLGSLTISAGGTAIAVKPFERDGFDRSFEGVAHDGRIHVTLSGWSRPQDYWGAWLLGSPAGFDKVRSVTPPWPDRKTDLEAYARGGGERAYVDARHYTQCRDYGSDVPMIWCIVVADDEQYSYGVKLDATNRQRLPQVLATLSGAIDAMRGACPKTSSGAVQ